MGGCGVLFVLIPGTLVSLHILPVFMKLRLLEIEWQENWRPGLSTLFLALSQAMPRSR